MSTYSYYKCIAILEYILQQAVVIYPEEDGHTSRRYIIQSGVLLRALSSWTHSHPPNVLRSGHFMTDHRDTERLPCILTGQEGVSFENTNDRMRSICFLNCSEFRTFKDEAIRNCDRLHAGALAPATSQREARLNPFHAFATYTVYGTAAVPSQHWPGLTPPLPPG